MWFVRSTESELLFSTIDKVYKNSKYGDENISKLIFHKLINTDNSLTLRGKKFMFASMLKISIRELEILIMAYDHRNTQKSDNITPMSFDVIASIMPLKKSTIYGCLKTLVNNNHLDDVLCKHFIIADSTYNILKRCDGDIMEIEKTLGR